MIDTIRIKSPYLSLSDVEKIRPACELRQAVKLSTGQLIYEFTSGELLGSYDYRIRFSLSNEGYIFNSDLGVPEKCKTDWYIIIECSVSKLLHGHNLFASTRDVSVAVAYVVDLCSRLLDVELPEFHEWEILRLDYSKNFDLGSEFVVRSYIRTLFNSEFPRRIGRRNTYGDSSIYFSGTTTTVKFYAKGPEFRAHDAKRLKKGVVSVDELTELNDLASRLLRVEVQVNEKKLDYDFKRSVFCFDLTEEYLEKLYKNEVEKVVKCMDSKNIVRDAISVRKRLIELYGTNKGNSILGTWYQLTTLGEEATRSSMSKATYYRHRRALIDAGVSWLGSDVCLSDSIIPADFQPFSGDKRVFEFGVEKVKDLTKDIEKYVEFIRRSA